VDCCPVSEQTKLVEMVADLHLYLKRWVEWRMEARPPQDEVEA